MPKYRVVTPKGASFTVAGGGYDYEKEALDPIGAEIIEAPANEAEFIAAAKTADAIYAKGMPITKTIIDALENCKVITLGSVGVDSVDVKAATARGIPVTNIPDTFIEEVADHAMMLLLAGFRRLVEQDKMVRTGRWSEGRPALLKIPRLMGQTLGFISFGRVARAVAKRAAPFGLRMMAYDPFIQETLMYDHGVIPSTLYEVLSQSDFVSMHAPARPEVHHMLAEKHFRQMKKTAVFINTGRGATVDEEALIKALQEGWIAHAALDVLEKEPPSHNNPMLSHGKRHPDRACRLCIGTFRRGAQAPRRLRIVTGPAGHVAGKLRQSVGAAKHRASPLATCQHGSRPEQLRRQEGVFGRSGERSAPAGRNNNRGNTPPVSAGTEGLRVHRRFNAGNRKTGRVQMTTKITRRDALALGVSAAALAATGASAQSAIKAADVAAPKFAIEKGASLRMLRPVRFVQADEDVFRANCAKFTKETGVEVKVDFVGWEDINQQTAVTSNSGAGPDIIIGFSDAPHIYVDKLVELTDVADYLGKRYGGWLPLAQTYGKKQQEQRLDRIAVRRHRRPADLPQVDPAIGRLRQGAGRPCRIPRRCARSCTRPASRPASRSATPSRRRQRLCQLGCCGRTTLRCSMRRATSSSTARRPSPR